MLTNFSNARASVKKADVHHGRATWGHFFSHLEPDTSPLEQIKKEVERYQNIYCSWRYCITGIVIYYLYQSKQNINLREKVLPNYDFIFK